MRHYEEETDPWHIRAFLEVCGNGIDSSRADENSANAMPQVKKANQVEQGGAGCVSEGVFLVVGIRAHKMMNKFFLSGLESGTRFNSPANGYDSRKEKTSFTAKCYYFVTS